ncbi:MAG TPA: trypsin-like serine protease [Flavipsychrobacter sp.]|nr:trypsin-like serine protease [Flavipsychrobacter sp.]
MKKKSSLIIALFLLVLTSKAGIYRHDREESQYTTLAAQPQFDCVGQLWKGNEFHGSCVLVGGKYVLSAAHCFIESSYRPDTIVQGNQTIIVNQPYDQHIGKASDYNVVYNGMRYQCKELKIYPSYMDTATHDGLDVALLVLEEDVKDIKPALMNSSFNELHTDVTGVGYGVNGPADKPGEIGNAKKKLAGENVIDSLGGYTLNDNQTVMFCDFDHPTDTGCNKMGSAVPRDLEYICGGGDSGGGLFRQTENGWELIGICHGGGVNIQQLMKTGYYGQVMSWTRVSVFKNWIEENMK